MTFVPQTIYKDLIRMVHPDLHPTMKDALIKSQQVNAVKTDPQALRRLAITWGYVKPTSADTIRTTRTFNWENIRRPVRPTIVEYKVGDCTKILRGNFRGYKGIFVHVTPIIKGKYHGFTKYTLYVMEKNVFTTYAIRDYERIALYFEKTECSIHNVSDAMKKWIDYQKSRNIYRAKTLSELNLAPNRDYTRVNYKIRICIGGIMKICKVIRTTSKCVVVDYNGTEKVVRINNIIGRER
jgi:hypothetical protein